ncbi:MAG TPA: DNA polymerase Y family protein [Bryobacteraceae bacterium]|nr:DNA polymerase Y family protein [Bryobacteraceae bacterium]
MSRRLLCLYLSDLPQEPTEQNRVKQRLIQWCNRYSPIVADDDAGGIVLDITGCAHLFGGEEALLNDIQTRIRAAGQRVRGAIADTLGAAWALARYSKQVIVIGSELPQALNPLPVEGLRLPEDVTRALRRVGLTSIGAFHKIGRQALVTRFGASTLLRLDQAFGQIEEAVTPYRQPAPYSIRRALPEPIAYTGAVEHVVAELVTELCLRLRKDHTGARRLNLECYRVDGAVSTCGVSTSKPVRSVKHLMRLFSEKIETIDAGFGIETLILSVLNFDRFDPAQLTLTHFDPDRNDNIEAFDELIDRIGMRLGFEHVSRLRIQQSFLPELALQFESVMAPVTPNAIWPEYRLRPVYWVDPPMRIEVATIHPAGSPVQFRMGRDARRIVKSEGPERLTPEWWRLESRVWQVRDYYRIEDDRGCRFWIFQEFYAAATLARRWFLRGHLP